MTDYYALAVEWQHKAEDLLEENARLRAALGGIYRAAMSWNVQSDAIDFSYRKIAEVALEALKGGDK